MPINLTEGATYYVQQAMVILSQENVQQFAHKILTSYLEIIQL